jgi:hypothetical protein
LGTKERVRPVTPPSKYDPEIQTCNMDVLCIKTANNYIIIYRRTKIAFRFTLLNIKTPCIFSYDKLFSINLIETDEYIPLESQMGANVFKTSERVIPTGPRINGTKYGMNKVRKVNKEILILLRGVTP